MVIRLTASDEISLSDFIPQRYVILMDVSGSMGFQPSDGQKSYLERVKVRTFAMLRQLSNSVILNEGIF